MIKFNHNFKQKSPKKRFLFVFGMFFFLLYLFMGLAVIFWKNFPLELSQTQKIALGVVLIVYAFLRFIRLLQERD
jgi:hypothetical protein